MKSMKRVAALAMAILFVGVGVLSNVGTVSNVEAAAKISTKKKTLNQGQSVDLKITGGKGTIKWSVNNDNVKLDKKTGKKVKVTAVKAGKSKVTANVKGKKLVCTVKVNGLTVVKKELNVGQKFTLKVKGLGTKVKWSQKGNVVTVKGKKAKATVTAKKVGTGTVIAKIGKKKYKCTVVVSKPVVSGSNKVSVNSGSSTKLTLGGVATGTVVSWKSSNSSLVKVEGTGANATVTVIGTADVATDVTVSAVVNGTTYTWTVTVPATVVETEPVEGESADNPIYVMQEPPLSVAIPAGKVVYYSISNAGGKELTIEAPNAYVIIDGTQYNAVDGVVSLIVPRPMYPMMPVVIGVGNAGATDAEFSVNLAAPVGTMSNPEVVTDGTGTLAFVEGNEGYYLTYTAEMAGIVNVTVSADTGWTYCVNNLTAGKYGDSHWNDDEPVVNKEQVAVAYGDELQIFVSTYDPESPWTAPAGNVTVTIENEGQSFLGFDYMTMVATADIAAGDLNAYQAYNVGGKIITINDASAYVIVNGAKYTAVDGVVSLVLPSAFGRMPSEFAIGNAGDVDATYTIIATDPVGTWGNPEVVTETGTYTKDFAEGQDAYYYSYTATEDGTLKVSVDSTTGWYYNVQTTGGYYGENHWSDDDPVVSTEEFSVTAGDVVTIFVQTYDGNNYGVEGTITWSIEKVTPDTGLGTDEDTDDGYGEIF